MRPRARSGAGERSEAWTGPRVRAVVDMVTSQQAGGLAARKAAPPEAWAQEYGAYRTDRPFW
ncbi:hypothetical protein GCM10017772_28120 [Promicromonospora soli]|uniref:Uncharacterized protein n=1 Tax=Promicromonospora soli TaxID=2035533 RepID=A0A919FXQ6_9MICO|nr:hypothetical protein GCM10017772_28120 [Promicromonospora soli]